MTKVCGKCKELKDHSDFHKSKIRKDGLHPVCKTCRKIEHNMYYKLNKSKYIYNTKKRRDEIYKFIIEYLTNHPCVDCGETDIRVLDFDHVRGTKRACISELRGAALNTVINEIQKCEVRCANCHRRKTFKHSYRNIF